MTEATGTEATADIGVIGMAVMGRNLAMNIADRGFAVAVHNRSPGPLAEAVAASDGALLPMASLGALVASLKRPRRLWLMIAAGDPVDRVLDQLGPLLEPGDVVIEGGNSRFHDTRRREVGMREVGLRFIGVGVSGGEEGARFGPSLMPGGDGEAYAHVAPVLEAIAARTEHGACVTHVGPDGAGHFVKMVHNGIEYADMQVIAEGYHLLRTLLGMQPPALADTFARWNEGPLESFLIEITAGIFRTPDDAGGEGDGAQRGWLIDRVLDRAGQKGTGRWTAEVALELGVPVPSIAAAIDARVLSSMKAARVAAADVLPGPAPPPPDGADRDRLVAAIHDALLASKIAAYAQGMALIRAASDRFGWDVDLRELARIWTGGCIIRARLLPALMEAFERDPALPNLLLDPGLGGRVVAAQGAWREVVGRAAAAGIPVPAMSAGLAYLDALRSAELPQNLTQAQRDAFGAHTYQRNDVDDPPFVHSRWRI